jgi:hypothetical protein
MLMCNIQSQLVLSAEISKQQFHLILSQNASLNYNSFTDGYITRS